MSVIDKSASRDAALEGAFGARVAELYLQAAGAGANAALQRALELRSFLALSEEQVALVRDRVHEATAADRDMDGLSAEALRWDAQWLEAAVAGRNGYAAALDDLLRTMPAPEQRNRQQRHVQPKITAIAPPAPAARRAGEVRPRRP